MLHMREKDEICLSANDSCFHINYSRPDRLAIATSALTPHTQLIYTLLCGTISATALTSQCPCLKFNTPGPISLFLSHTLNSLLSHTLIIFIILARATPTFLLKFSIQGSPTKAAGDLH